MPLFFPDKDLEALLPVVWLLIFFTKGKGIKSCLGPEFSYFTYSPHPGQP